MANTAAVCTPGEALSGARQTRFCFIDALRGLARSGHRLAPPQYLRAVTYHDQPVLAGLGLVYRRMVLGRRAGLFCDQRTGHRLQPAERAITPAVFGNFVLRRSIRLDPSYWVVIGLVLALHFLPDLVGLPSPHASPITAGQVVAHLFYLQYLLGYGESFSAGFWTLCIEMQFYLLFCLLLWLAQRPTLFGKQTRGESWAIAIVFFPLATTSLWAFNLDHRYEDWILFFFCMFFLGSLVWWTLEGRLSAWFLWAYVAMMAARLTWQWGIEIAVALAAGLIIYGVGRAGHLSDWLRWRPLMYFGRISYSLYLIHYSVIHLVVHVGHRLTGDAPLAACGWTVVALVFSVLAAHVLHVLVEAPTARLASRLKQRPALAVIARESAGSMVAVPPRYPLDKPESCSRSGNARARVEGPRHRSRATGHWLLRIQRPEGRIDRLTIEPIAQHCMQRRIDFIKDRVYRRIAKRHVEPVGMRTAEAKGVEGVLLRTGGNGASSVAELSSAAHAVPSCCGGYVQGAFGFAVRRVARIPPLEARRIISPSNPE